MVRCKEAKISSLKFEKLLTKSRLSKTAKIQLTDHFRKRPPPLPPNCLGNPTTKTPTAFLTSCKGTQTPFIILYSILAVNAFLFANYLHFLFKLFRSVR